LLDGDAVTLHGRWVSVDGARNEPPPVHQMPLMIAGSGERRTLPVVARYADAWNGEGDPGTFAGKCRVLTERCEAIGRDPASIVHTVGAPPVCIRDTREEAVRDLAAILERNALGGDEARSMAEASPLAGNEAAVLTALEAWADAGAAEVIIDRPAPFDGETLVRLARALALAPS
jgi:alkanesulfonate monooxygenase SsuD/methylene tetrahydromethanopterin reductase-like flavin-dependent oxidoreductase (luciferase family)